MQLADEEMSKARSVSASDALLEMQENPEILLVDVRDAEEVAVTGLGAGAINAPGRSIAWKACREFHEAYREPQLQDRTRRILTTCGSSPCYRGASAANLLTEMGFSDVAYVDGGMAELLVNGLCTDKPVIPAQT